METYEIDQKIYPTKKCAKMVSLKDKILGEIENCTSSPEGKDLYREMGEKVEEVDPPLRGIPVIIFNNDYNHDVSEEAQSNLIKAMCHGTSEKLLPKFCLSQNRTGSYTSGSTTNSSAYYFVMFMVIIVICVCTVVLYQYGKNRSWTPCPNHGRMSGSSSLTDDTAT